jgi:peptidoglycan/xylan/chitin deacetylase (PgdA/CDA1 family)
MAKQKKKYCLITNDVETTSLWNHILSDKTGEIVLKEGMPALLNAYRKYNIKATFYFTGHIAKLYPDVVRMILPDGHEVGCHGLTHESDQAFDMLNLEQQIDHLTRSKEILENICNQQVISFRAPALRVNQFTPKALENTGFLIDSSVAPQRMDMFLSFGSMNKLQWVFAPRNHYYTSENNLSRPGKGKIFEIPINSMLLPYTGTMMRISPTLTKVTRYLLDKEASFFKHPLVFLIHPNELIDEEITESSVKRRAKNYFSYILGDKLRYHLKLKNLGTKAIPLFEDQLNYLQRNNYVFLTTKEYYNIFK